MSSDWTVDTLKEYIDRVMLEHATAHAEQHHASELAIKLKQDHVDTQVQALDRRMLDLFIASEKAVASALVALEKTNQTELAAQRAAVNKAEIAAEKRFEGVNEFRGQLADQQRTLMPRAEADAELRAIRESLSTLASRLDRSEGRGGGMNALYGYIAGGVGIISAIVAIVLNLLR
jgi:hypothetical protein